MPDQLTDDQLGNLFADLHADEFGRVIPPGTADVRATVRRRRAMTTVTAAIAALAITGGITAGLETFGSRHLPTASEQTSAGPKLSQDELQRYSALAEAAINRAARGKEAIKVIREPRIPQTAGDFDSLRSLRGIKSISGNYSGSHTVFVSCVGVGTIQIAMSVGSLDDAGEIDLTKSPFTRTERVPCAAPGSADDATAVGELAAHVTTFPFTAPDGADLKIELDHPDAAAMNGASFALGFPTD